MGGADAGGVLHAPSRRQRRSCRHEEHPQIAEQPGLQFGLGVPFWQVEEVEQVAVLEDACSIWGKTRTAGASFLLAKTVRSKAAVFIW